MVSNFNLDKFLKNFMENKDSSKETASDEALNKLVKEMERVEKINKKIRQENEIRLNKQVEEIYNNLDQINFKLKTDINNNKLLFDKWRLLTALLATGANIPESKAEGYYEEINNIVDKLIKSKFISQEEIQNIKETSSFSLALYYRNQCGIYVKQYTELKNFSQLEKQGKVKIIIRTAEKALNIFKSLEDSSTKTLELSDKYEIRDDSIISNKSMDGKITYVRVQSNKYEIFNLLNMLINFNEAEKNIEIANKYREEVEKLNIGFQIKKGNKLI